MTVCWVFKRYDAGRKQAVALSHSKDVEADGGLSIQNGMEILEVDTGETNEADVIAEYYIQY